MSPRAELLRPLTGGGVVVLAPHPDDEAIFTGLIIARLVAAGVEVSVVYATDGSVGQSRIALPPGCDLGAVRAAESRHAAGLLGVSAVGWLGFRDSGMAGSADNTHPAAFAANLAPAAARLRGLLDELGAVTLLTQDDRGIYAHPDHVAAHVVGHRAAVLANLAAVYDVTADAAHLDRAGLHPLDVGAAPRAQRPRVGASDGRVDLTVPDGGLLPRKHAAMAAHRSQLAGLVFADDALGTEWLRRHRGRDRRIERIAG